MSRKPLTDKGGEVRDLTLLDIRRMKPAEGVLPERLLAVLPKRRQGERGPQKLPTKQQVTLRLDRQIVERFRATGAGWQGRINEALKKALP